jgi:hypothetical protein
MYIHVQACFVQGEKHALDRKEPLSPNRYLFSPAGTMEKGQEKHGCNQDCVGRTETCKGQRTLVENASTENAKITLQL